MRFSLSRSLIIVVLLAGCAAGAPNPESDSRATGMTRAGEEYTRCMSAQLESDATKPVAAEEMAAAAQGRCWAQWQAYGRATREEFMSDARTPAEAQLARDKADAHLRQFELQTRRAVTDSIVQRSLKAPEAK